MRKINRETLLELSSHQSDFSARLQPALIEVLGRLNMSDVEHDSDIEDILNKAAIVILKDLTRVDDLFSQANADLSGRSSITKRLVQLLSAD